MERHSDGKLTKLFGILSSCTRRGLFSVLSVGPIPNHVAFILDGNRRYAKKWNLKKGAGHKAGFLALTSMLKYCYELGVKYITIYAFSIDNFKRRPEEVQPLMDLMLEKIEGLLKEETPVNQYGVRVYFVGNLKLLNEPVRVAAEKAMLATSNNSRTVLLICVAYSSSDEIVHAVQESCHVKKEVQTSDEIVHAVQESCRVRKEVQTLNGALTGEKHECNAIKSVDLSKHMYMAIAPDPDILIRTSGETRLSNFLLWQTTNCVLFCPSALWPEIGLWHLVWAVLNFQRSYSYLEKKKKQL